MQTRVNTNPHVEHFVLNANEYFPNNLLPVLLYRSALVLPRQKNRAAEITQQIFLRNNWGNTWRNGIYDFHHYHSNTHECLAIAMGTAEVILGGPGGRKEALTAGDVIILPAGTGHKCQQASEDFLCVGSYPQARDYDINHGTAEEWEQAQLNIEKVPLPKNDPLFGLEGFLKSFWKNA